MGSSIGKAPDPESENEKSLMITVTGFRRHGSVDPGQGHHGSAAQHWPLPQLVIHPLKKKKKKSWATSEIRLPVL